VSTRRGARLLVVCLVLLLAPVSLCAQTDPLPSWNDGPAKQSIVAFVQKVIDSAGPQFVPPEQRIATFDNDGTLWSEQPIYFQFAFALARVKALAPKHPEWKTQQPFKAVLDGDLKALAASGEKGMIQLLLATHTGMTTDEFTKTVTEWIATAQHPRFKRPYTELVFQPMLELLAYLRANSFKTYIVSGGDDEFERVQLMAIQYVPLLPTLYLGLRGDAAAVFGDAPFYLKPFVSLRGAPIMRYQGNEAASIEAELRWQFWRRFSAVAFGGFGAAWTDFGRFKHVTTVPTGGVGFRYEIARKYGIHMGLDLAFGPDNTAVYVQVGRAWARP
jgi:hypothetical protein